MDSYSSESATPGLYGTSALIMNFNQFIMLPLMPFVMSVSPLLFYGAMIGTFVQQYVLNPSYRHVKNVRVTTWNSEIYDVNYSVRTWSPFHPVDNPRPKWHSFIYVVVN